MAGMKKLGRTRFELEYGERIEEFAARECVTTEAVWNRIRMWGSPYQRRAKPTKYERQYARTQYEIAEEINRHPHTVICNLKKGQSAFTTTKDRPGGWPGPASKFGCANWREAIQAGHYASIQHPWLHPLHPDYAAWRSGVLFESEHQADSQLTSAEVEQMMAERNWPGYILEG